VKWGNVIFARIVMDCGWMIEVRFQTEILRFEQSENLKATSTEGTVLLCLLFEVSLISLLFRHKEGSNAFFQKVGKILPGYTRSRPRK
jgi:hypothetical protein